MFTVKIVKKGESFGFFKNHFAQRDQHHVKGTKEECITYAKEHNLRLDLHKITGTHAPADAFYGIAD